MGNTLYEKSLNHLYNSVVWTHKIQRTYLEHLEFRRKVLSIIEIIFAGASSFSTLICSVFETKLGTIISAALVMGSFVFSEILKQVETQKDINNFKESSTKLMMIRNELELIVDDIKAQKITDEIVRAKIDFISEKFANITNELRTIPNRIVDEASKKLKDRKDEEVDFKLL